MIEETHPDDDSYIVRVKAVVMTRDDSSGGWLAQEAGGAERFIIYGERLKDKQVILECFLKKDLIYTKATPTFHHWKVEDRKCGLTFTSPADARAFDRGVRKAIEDLTEGSTTSSSTIQNEVELGDDDVFTSPADSSSNSAHKREQPRQPLAPANVTICEPHRHHCLLGHFHDPYRPSHHFFLDQPLPTFPRHVSFRDDEEEEEVVRINPRERAWLTGYEDYRHAAAPRVHAARPEDSDAYVHFAKSEPPKHDYTYPCAPGRDPKGGWGEAGVIGTQPRPSKPAGGKRRKEDGERSRCVYCRDVFNREDNRRGRCQDAPDPVRTCIGRVSFMWCADSLLYHCLSDPEGDYSDPCSCDASDERFLLRWLALLGLSVLAPCMCCYPPLRACHRCGAAWGCCGGRHKAVG
ncbi:hypothetical protein AAFF_G00062620 [Aldrovandia affinis]|uniref:Sprouty-related, EVH1 domain-containing protein 2 n=1 Tax=Aldrovandia affinis TaxID=143900 RepID=A0AAD7RZJ0_9TELE|nr:hypothetical protein AAFF_G00062620 [Aldrovandia affinis]